MMLLVAQIVAVAAAIGGIAALCASKKTRSIAVVLGGAWLAASVGIRFADNLFIPPTEFCFCDDNPTAFGS